MSAFKTTFLVLTFAAVQFLSANVWALPTVTDTSQFTDRLAPSQVPTFPVGDKVQIGAFLDSTDPVGSPTISVQAIQGGTTVVLDPPTEPIPGFSGHFYGKFVDFDPGLTGQWQIVPTDSTGTGPSAFTNAIVEPQLLPFVEDVTLQGTPLGTRVAWTLPNLASFDVDGILVGIVDSPIGTEVWRSEFLPPQTTSYELPAGVFEGDLQVGVDYLYYVLLGDSEDGRFENVSRGFSQLFRHTIAGDFNTDGTVDAADYVVWRNGLGATYTQSDYHVWRANFGTSLGVGSGSVLPSAESLSAPVPEPSAAVLLTFSMAPVFFAPRRRSGQNIKAFAGGQELLLKMAAQSAKVNHAAVHAVFENLAVEPSALSDAHLRLNCARRAKFD